MQMQRNAQAMNSSPIDDELKSWEDDGGATPVPIPGGPSREMSGTQNQVEWSDQIKLRVNSEFDRVAASIRSRAEKRNEERRAETEALLSILESKRSEVMGRRGAAYFIHGQEIAEQVRRMILSDERYLAMKAKRKAQGGRLQHSDELESKGKR